MAHERERIRRDNAGVGPDPGMAGRLYRLGDLNFKIADGEPDIRGWEVRTLSGNEIGEVDDLLIDPHRGEVVMLDIDLKDSEQHVNIPIRGVQLDRERNCVVVDSGDILRARESYMGERIEDVRVDGDTRADDARAGERLLDRNADGSPRELRYARPLDSTRDSTVGDSEEVVVERRPVIEEVVVRRRVVDADEVEDELKRD